MPVARFEMPDGRVARFEVPDGTTPEAAQQMMAGYDFGAPEPPKEMPGIGRTALDQSMQGATFGFGDEISDRIGAGIASVATGEKYGDLLKEARDNSKKRLVNQMEERPVLSIGSNITGALLTGGAGATTKTGTAATNFLRSGNLAARIGKGALAGAASGGLYGAGTAEEGNRLEGAKEGAAFGAAVGGAIPAAGAIGRELVGETKNAITGLTARSVDDLDESIGAIKSKSNQAYQAMRDAGATINRPRAVNITNRVQKAIESDGKLNASLHSNTLSVMDDFKKAAREGDFTLEELDQWRQLFGQVAGNFSDPVNQRKASIAIRAIDDAVDNLSGIDIKGGSTKGIEALNTGRSEWARARRFETISDVIKKSDGDANYLKRELKKILDNPKKHRGFSAEELAALKEASSITGTEGIMKMLGKFGIDLGNSRIGNTALPVLAGGATSMASGLGTGAAVPVVGTAARYGQKAIARGKAENLLRAIEGAAPQAAKTPAITSGVAPAALEGSVGPMAIPAETIPQTVTKIEPLSYNTQVPETDYYSQLGMVESSNNPNAQAKTSSAFGKYQITQGTANNLIKKYGKEHGITQLNWKLPANQEKLARLLTTDNLQALQGNLDRLPTKGELYAAHFLGANGALQLINAMGSNEIAAKLFPEAARANRSIFYDKMRPRTVEELYELLTSKVA